MAARFFVGGGTSTNWGQITTTNWGLTSGTHDNSAVPTSSDAVTFDGGGAGNSACVVAAAAVCASLTITSGYTSTITFNFNISVSGSITLANAGYTLAGAGLLRMIAAGTWTTNGKTVAVPVEIGGTTTFTCTLADALTTSASLTLTNTTSTIFAGAFALTGQNITVSGSQTLTLVANLVTAGTLTFSDANIVNGAFEMRCASLTTTGALTGTATVRFTAAGTWQGAAANSCNTIIDTGSGVRTLGSPTLFAASGTPTLTYTSSGQVLGGSLSIASSCTITGGGDWSNWANSGIILTAALTLTCNSAVSIGTITFPNANVTLAGSDGLTAGTWSNTAIASSSKTITLTSGNTYACAGLGGAMQLTGTSAALTLTLISSHATNKVAFNLGPGVAQDMIFVNATRIDSTGGQPCYSARGVFTTCFNWINVPEPNLTILPSFQLGI